MDQLPPLGTAIGQIVRPTQQIYGALLQQYAAKITSTARKTFSYGSDPRQNLDVYYPSASPSGAGCPILIFLYGGGLVNGAKTLPTIENGLAYANLGHFFADKCEFVVIVADYRLFPQARFPSGGEDLALIVEWTRSNLRALGSGNEKKSLFITGNSAGGVHVSTYLFYPAFAESRKQVLGQSDLRLKDIVLLSVPVHFQKSDPSRRQVLTGYYSNRVDEDCPLGLLKALNGVSSVSDTLPSVNFLSMTGSLDSEDEILIPNKDFADAWNASKSAQTSNLQIEIMDGHNHISPPFALSTYDSKEEAWGFQVAKFCTSAAEQ